MHLLTPLNSTDKVRRQTSKDETAETPTQENLTQPLVPEKKRKSLGTHYNTLATDNGHGGHDNGHDNGHNGQASASPRSLGARLQLRNKLMKRRRWLVNVEFVMAMTGILLMMVDNELYYADHSVKDSAISFVLKLAITLTTAVLLCAICLYYQAGIELRMFDGRVDDPLAVTPISTWLTLVLELMMCAIHPFPGNIQAEFLTVHGVSSRGSVDGILSVLMMLRLYLVGKFIVVHSQLLTDPSTQSVAAVSHVKVNINFVFKAALNKHPAEVIAAIILAMYAVSVWSMRTCELYYTHMPEKLSVPESMWLAAITFLTVGYGDLTPTTNCGRFIAVCTATMGLCSTALLVAVIARKLEQTHQERYVHNFLVRVHLRNRFKAAAADVIKLTLKLWGQKKRRGRIPVSAMDRTVLQWRLRSAIRTMRSTRASQAEVEEASVGLSEVCQLLGVLDKRQQAWESGQREVMRRLQVLQGCVESLCRSGDGGSGDGGNA
ncbi:small conductance calcium-activated potassium channel protein 2-like isoform X2 [Babylonia areolata]|uniref:small conductance calcium-activated potassium channel protein 2-like isoform X2 n=1 Tax=Babylonia areolata TaxID=304850 RepID=UPI003FD4EB42